MVPYDSYFVEAPNKILISLRKKRGKTKKEPLWFYLNLNAYRNTHHMTLSQAKVLFKEHMLPKLKDIPVLSDKGIALRYTVYARTKQKFDIANICSIVDKFFSDVLVETGKIPDDNFEYIKNVHYRYGGVNPENPHILIEIRSRK